MRETYLNEIKSFEGFAARAQWDYAQFTNGYGTKARFDGEKIDEAEANRRFAAELAEARKFVDKHAEGWDEGTKAALTSLTFNAGTRWASSGLGEAVRSFDVDGVRDRFLAYTKAGGVDLPGLVKRRLEEVTWIGNDGDMQSSRVAAVAKSAASIEAAVAQPTEPAPLIASAASSVSADATPSNVPIDSGHDARAMASLSLILLTLDLTPSSALGSSRRGDDGGRGPERA